VAALVNTLSPVGRDTEEAVKGDDEEDEVEA
jgi:hypothetical protein